MRFNPKSHFDTPNFQILLESERGRNVQSVRGSVVVGLTRLQILFVILLERHSFNLVKSGRPYLYGTDSTVRAVQYRPYCNLGAREAELHPPCLMLSILQQMRQYSIHGNLSC